ncbi:MAG: hypothetical protein ACI319_10775 [Holdemanella porci]
MKKISISKDEIRLSKILGGVGSIDGIDINDSEHMLPLYCKTCGGNQKKKCLFRESTILSDKTL